MRSHRGSWLGSSILAAAFILAPASAAVRAQPGYGPDPFWPYNNQYTPYVTPMGPADPEAGGPGVDGFARNGLRGANRFQDYLDDLQGGGPGRNLSDRSNIGMPYYRSAVDPAYSTGRAGARQYQPNYRSNETFEDSQRSVSQIYFRYYSERDPARRSELLRQYRAARRDAASAITGRGRSPSRALESSSRLEAGIRRGTRAGSTPPVPGLNDRSRPEADRVGPAPEVPAYGSRRSSGGASPRRTTPSDVLDRSRAMDRNSRSLFSRPGSMDPLSPSRPRGLAPAPPSPSGPSPSRSTPDRTPVDDPEP